MKSIRCWFGIHKYRKAWRTWIISEHSQQSAWRLVCVRCGWDKPLPPETITEFEGDL